jgi:hypothetical protein
MPSPCHASSRSLSFILYIPELCYFFAPFPSELFHWVEYWNNKFQWTLWLSLHTVLLCLPYTRGAFSQFYKFFSSPSREKKTQRESWILSRHYHRRYKVEISINHSLAFKKSLHSRFVCKRNGTHTRQDAQADSIGGSGHEKLELNKSATSAMNVQPKTKGTTKNFFSCLKMWGKFCFSIFPIWPKKREHNCTE